MKSYLYDVNASDVSRSNPRICDFTQRAISLTPILEIFIVLNEKDAKKEQGKG